jgi:hypothetical protein
VLAAIPMALHHSPASMLKESLEETLEAARLCVVYEKRDPKWGQFRSNGCLGYPGAILLFSIVDTIGSYYRQHREFKAHIEGKKVAISAEGWEHFKIFNTKYFKQNLSTSFIKVLYSKFRSYLTHNSVLGKNALMFPKDIDIDPISYYSRAFATSKQKDNSLIYAISILELYKLCVEAVTLFKADIDEIVPESKQGRRFH